MGAAVAVAPLIDDEGLAKQVGVDLVGAEQVDHIDLALLGPIENSFDVPAPLARNQAEIEARNAGGGGMQYAEPVPADVRLHRTHSDCRLCSEGKHRGSVGARKRGLADDDEQP